MSAEGHSSRHHELDLRRLDRTAPSGVVGIERVIVLPGQLDYVGQNRLPASSAATTVPEHRGGRLEAVDQP